MEKISIYSKIFAHMFNIEKTLTSALKEQQRCGFRSECNPNRMVCFSCRPSLIKKHRRKPWRNSNDAALEASVNRIKWSVFTPVIMPTQTMATLNKFLVFSRHRLPISQTSMGFKSRNLRDSTRACYPFFY